MSSRFVGNAIFAVAEVIAAFIRKGKRLPILAGAICGGIAGAMAPVPMLNLRAITAILGAIAGATAAAVLFPRPRSGFTWPIRWGRPNRAARCSAAGRAR